MKSLQLFQLLLILFICFACRNKKVYIEENKDITYIYIDSLSNENIISKNKEKHRFIKLETTANCLVTKIERMDFDDNKIFIKDSNEKIFVFDNQGKFLNNIGQIGQGPNEHYSIFDFYLDKSKKRICVVDILKSAIFSYSYTGDLLEKKWVNRNIFRNFSHIYLAGNNTLLSINYNSLESKYNFSLVSGNNYDNVNNFVPYLFIGEKYPQSTGRLPVTESRNKIFLSALISDTIYRYDPDTKKIIPDIVFKGKYRPMTKKDVEGKHLEIAMDALLTAKEEKLSYGITDLAMTQKYLNFIVQDYNSVNRVIWNMDTKKGCIFKTYDNSMLNNFFTYLIAATDDAFVCAIPADVFTSVNWIENESAKEVAAKTLEDDNPIIAFYYFE